MIDNSLKKLLENIEPKIQNIEEHRIELKTLDEVNRTMQELMELSESSHEEILNFYDQDFIFRAIKIKNPNFEDLITKFHSSKYLLKNKDIRIKELPQYQESLKFIDYLYEYFKGLYEEIKFDYQTKQKDLEIEELQNKYYLLLNKDNVFIQDIDEFLTFIDIDQVSDLDKLNIYKQICKDNLKQYTKSDKIKLDDNIGLEDVEELININKELLSSDYVETPDLNKELKDYLKEITDVKVDDFVNRKKYLIHKIKELYDNKQYIEVIDYYKDFLKIEELESEFQKQIEVPRKLLFVFKDDKSLVRDFINETTLKYKNCVLKNLLDIENEEKIFLPVKKHLNKYIYENEDYEVKTVYSFVEKGKVLLLGVLNKDEDLDEFLEKNEDLYKETFNHIETVDLINDERDILLKNIKLEDLVLNIDLETLDIKRED